MAFKKADAPTPAEQSSADESPRDPGSPAPGTTVASAHAAACGTVDIRPDGIAIVTLDQPDAKVNTLSRMTMEWFDKVINDLAAMPGLNGAIIASAKQGNFIAGANIEEMRAVQDREELVAMTHGANRILDKLEALPAPVVAAIHGSCLGGGLELAMACHFRIATDDRATKLGFPEVQLGLFPAAGGTYRAPRLAGIERALELILTGKQVDANKARRMGLVHEVVHPADLLKVSLEYALRNPPQKKKGGWLGKLPALGSVLPSFAEVKESVLEKGPVRTYILKQARESVRKSTGEHYPAPYVAIDMVEKGLAVSREDSFAAVEQTFADLAFTDVAQNLMSLFFLRQGALKTKGGIKRELKAREIPRIGVLGAGLMGAGIAQACAYSGIQVRLKDVDMKAVGRGLAYCRARFDEMVKRQRLTPVQRDLYMGNISGTADYAGFSLNKLVVEAVFEDLDLKRRVLQEVESALPEDAIFASNTSSLPIADIAKGAKRPENVIGMHFFSPVHKMPLVEIIRAPLTSDQAVVDTLALTLAMGKVPIVVRDCAGFFTTRVLGPYMNEAAYLIQEGGDITDIDRALAEFGFPVGPITLMDEVGIDVGAKVCEILWKAYGDRMKPPASLERIVQDGRKGRKNGRGFFRYDGDRKGTADETVYDLLPGGRNRRSIPIEEIQDRCWLAMLNECARSLDENIVSDPETVDVGVIFGFGFPPFRGGILRYADRVGARTVVARLRELEDRFGKRFKPADCLLEMEATGRGFFK
ncbi:MAG: enoyl-CoA hydratase/isomerase family protein [Candidatus Schekmanbacteria bacterium]|nr:enoyl-CoA hydratase/isomerase family protein [Candidatus Schekmanbacteria bacterium]